DKVKETSTNISSEEFVRGPTVNLVTNNSAAIFWRTDTPTDALVEFGLNTSLLESVSNSTPDTDHLISLNGLEMDAKYYYRVESNGIQSEIYHFLTMPADGGEFNMIIAGDNRPDFGTTPNQPQAFLDIADLIIAEEPHLMVMLGDYVFDVVSEHAANLEAWKAFTDIADRIGHYVPIVGVLGNHDTGVGTGEYRPEYFHDAFINLNDLRTYFSFNYAGVHLIFLDSEDYGHEGRIIDAQYDWFIQDLAENVERDKLIFTHRPMFTTNHMRVSLDTNATERDALQVVLEENNVSLFAAGHDHAYDCMAVNGITHLIAGGLGAPFNPCPWGVDIFHYVKLNVNEQMTITVVKSDSTVYDEFSIPFEGPIRIYDREIVNGSSKPVGTMPVIYFSERPTTEYYSWDSGPNSTVLTGLPEGESLHTLDIYVEDDEGVWSTARYAWTTIMPDTSTPTDTTPPPGTSMDPLLIAGVAGLVGVVIVVGFLLKKKKDS
ncbi:MAG: metallophosphoesterase, partial [Candidatus Thorarchaeota archaeon]